MKYIKKIYIACLILMLLSLIAHLIGLRSFPLLIMGWSIPMGISYFCFIVYGILWSANKNTFIKPFIKVTIAFIGVLNALSVVLTVLLIIYNHAYMNILFLVSIFSLVIFISLVTFAVALDKAKTRQRKERAVDT